MSTDEPLHPMTGSPLDNQPENSLDELLDTVRDHLDDSLPGDDDIPVLTEVIVAAPATTAAPTNSGIEIESAELAPDSSIADLAEPTPEDTLDHLPDGTGEEQLPAVAATDTSSQGAPFSDGSDSSDDEAFEITQVAFSSETADDHSAELESIPMPFPSQWLERMDQLIDERCHALAEELKTQLHKPVDMATTEKDLDSAN